MTQPLAILCLIVLAAWSRVAGAASLDPSRITAIDQAADAFLGRAAEARKLGQVPRQSDPDVQHLIDTVFDTGELSHGPMPIADLPKLDDWLKRIVAVGGVYLAAGRAVRDLGVFGSEIGRFLDASVAVEQAITDCVLAEQNAHSGETPSPTDLRKLAQLRAAIAGSMEGNIDLLRAPGISVGWAGERLTGLRAAAPSMAQFLTPDQVARLRAAARRLAAAVRDRPLREALGGLMRALATPVPPPAETSPGSAEIALEGDRQGFWVPARINDALTVKFVVDSGAGVVVLPSGLVEKLTSAGAIASADSLGHSAYVTADGRKHTGAQVMLRELNVGGHIVKNVVASVAPAHAVPLLGQTFLAKFKSWTLDNRRHVLIISE